MKRQRGTTLIELMIALVVGMLLAVGVFSIMALAEGRRRTTTTVNTLNADGQLAMNQLDIWLRSTGSGLSNSANVAYGCELRAQKGGTSILPLSAALPEPFDAFGATTPIRMAPVVIWPDNNAPSDSHGGKSDVIAIMRSGTGGGGLAVGLAVAPATDTLQLKYHSFDFAGGDLVLVADPQTIGSAAADCAITQVQDGFVGGAAKDMPLAGDFAGTDLGSFSGDAVVLNLGNVQAATGAQGGGPQFLLVGVGEHSTLYTYNLLQSAGAGASPIAGGVLEMHALYGIGTAGDGKVSDWAAPKGDYAPDKLLDGSALAVSNLKTIKAIRIGLILRTTLPDRVERPTGQAPDPGKVITSTAPKLFTNMVDKSGTSLSYTRPWQKDEEKLYRYRTTELVLPLRNAIMVEVP